MMESHEKKATSNIQYLTFDDDGKICYSGFCKLQMNSLTKYLTVIPLADDIKPIGASFEWTFIKEKHILCILSPNNVQNFILVFKNTSVCKQVFNTINNYKTDVSSVLYQQQTYQERFLLPLFSELHDPNIVKILSCLIEAYSENETFNVIKFLKDEDLYETATSTFGDKLNDGKLLGNKYLTDSQQHQTRKRKIAEISKSTCVTNDNGSSVYNDKRILRKRLRKHTKVVHSANFKLMYAPLSSPRRLIIYTSSELTTFHEYKCGLNNRTFVCVQCNRKNTAIVEVDENGQIQAKLTAATHSCKPSEIFPEDYTQTTIVKKPNYKIVENGKSNKLLIIIDSDNASQCYEYYWNTISQKFYCSGCYTVKPRINNKSKARIYYEGTENEYVELLNDKHICEKRLYDTEKYQQCKEFVLRPDFEIHDAIVNGHETKKLIIFDQQDKNMCYYYNFVAFHGYFYCAGCQKHGKSISAKMQKNGDGEDYILLLNTNHICELKKYVPPSNDIILRSPEIEYMEETKTGIPKLFVFDKNDRKKCYTFTSYSRTSRNHMYCLECAQITDGRARVNGYFCKDEDGDIYCFRFKSDQKHLCQTKINNPEKFQSFKTYDFFYYRQRNKPQSIDLAIYHPSDKNLCYTFGYRKSGNFFGCKKCDCKRKTTTFYVKKSSDGKEYFEHDPKKHVCQPIKVSLICGPKFLKLKSNDISQKAIEKPSVSVDESKVIRKPNFELQPNFYGVLNKKLVIFHPDNKCLVYYYTSHARNVFMCTRCKKKNMVVNAKLYSDETDETDEKYVIMGKNEHVCKPAEYKPAKKIVESSNFKIFNQVGKSKSKKLIVFSSNFQELCYEYTYQNDRKCFRCFSCQSISGKFVSAKLLKKENNEEYILLSSIEHVCEPKKYEPEKFQQNNIVKIPLSLFELHENRNGEKDKRLIIFTSGKKEMYYSYSWDEGHSFVCGACSSRKKYLYAKLKENEDGEKYIETKDLSEHVCKPKKYEKEKFEEKVIVPKSMFQLCKNAKGEKDKHLLLFTSEKKDYVYKYSLIRSNYLCIKCSKKKWIAAKLKEDENGERFLELLSTKHVCKPVKV